MEILVAGDCISSALSADSFIETEFPLLSKLFQKRKNAQVQEVHLGVFLGIDDITVLL